MSSPGLVIWDSESLSDGRDSLLLVGGKAMGLHQLMQLNIPVPPWVVLTTALFRQVCRRDRNIARLLAGKNENAMNTASQLRTRIKDVILEISEEELLKTVWSRISGDGMIPVAVRSSAADEDSKLRSFAGQMDSFLNITDVEMFLDAVRSCWASLFGERAVLYRIQNRMDPWSPEIAVIVQQMIDADVSGVVFTANPLTGNRREMLVSSTWGLGEGLVAGLLDADTFILDTAGTVLRSELAKKEQRIVSSSKGGTEHGLVTNDQQAAASLNEPQLKELHDLALKVESSAGMPMDIEFAIAGGRAYLLQARPITTLALQADPGRDNFNVWDNSNIVESYSGVTTPFTFSFIKNAYFSVYWQFCEVIGVNRKTISRNRRVFENMLGLIQGRVYYNLLNWYRLISLMPGFSYNKKFMEQMMGLQVISEFTLEEAPSGKLEKYLVQLPRLLIVGLKMATAHLTLQKRIEEFHRHFAGIYARYSGMSFDTMTTAQIMQVYRLLEDEVLWKWKAPILNDFEAMIFYGLLRKLTFSWKLDNTSTLQNDLLCGEGGIRSTRVSTELASIALKIDKRAKLKAAFVEVSPEQALSLLRRDPAFSEINDEFSRYLKDYGVRSIDEMKLESVPVRDNPVFCISVIQNYLRTAVPDPGKQHNHEQQIRRNAEELLKERLRSRYVVTHPLRLLVFSWILKNTRNAIKNRENQRFCRAEAYSLIRDMARAIGRNWKARGLINDTEDIFYLTIDEVWSFIGGTATTTGLCELVAVRRKEFDAYRHMNPDDHIETYAEVYLHKDLTPKGSTEIKEEGIMLQGLGCCQGIVEKKVQIVISPDSGLKLNGEIMVARQTDPGWVVLFPSVGGLIIEKGSVLSHSAIVAREMGIPTVVGVKNATKVLRTGDIVRLNGASGEITIVKKAGA